MTCSATAQSDQAQTRPLVLVVEDEPSMLEILMVNLEASGFQVLGAGDGLEGWRLFEEQEPDLVVLDLNLPTISGFRLLELFRGASERPDVPVLALTALDFAEAEELVSLGLDGFISKPFDPRELVNTVRHLLARQDPGTA